MFNSVQIYLNVTGRSETLTEYIPDILLQKSILMWFCCLVVFCLFIYICFAEEGLFFLPTMQSETAT